ncbi:MAG: PBP1A family penicillin-binding protein [Peptococcaceae bacterium]|jgi:penicillin-binding protein 1A|nr:PBP1A family penicillin-binding protein [Peptococcaceae bacterium]
MAKSKGRRKIRKIVGRVILLLFLLFVILGFVATGLVAGYAYNVIKSIPEDTDLTVLAGDMTSYVYDREDNLIGEYHSEKDRVLLEPTEIPLRMKQAIVSIEDQRFFRHKGVDPLRIVGAARANLRSGSRGQGASTITMQVARLVILDVGNTEKNWDRKIKEAWIALEMEKIYSKEQILSFYLNNVYYGERAYSLATAAQNYFNRSINSLSLGEYAFLAGVVNGPGLFNPFTNMERAKNRQAIVLNEMVKMGYITEGEAAAAKAAPLNVVKSTVLKEESGDYANQSFLDYTFNEACAILGIDQSNAIRMYTGGYRVYTTLDVPSQAKAEELYANPEKFPNSNEEGKLIQSAMAVVEVNSGAVRLMIGGRDINEVRGFNRAADALRQPGSSFKPIASYGPALELGWNPGNVLDDYPDGFLNTEKKFVNSDRSYRGLVTLRTAVQRSLNTIAVKLIEQIGVQNGVDFAKKVGITTLVESGPVLDAGPALALGGLTRGVSPLEMSAAFAAFANGGIYNKPFAIRRIADHKGNVLYEHAPERRVAMSPQTAYLMTDMLVSAVSGGTGTGARLSDRPTAGKTGTTSENADAWFVGFTADLAGAIWMGYDIVERMPGVFGSTYCAPDWKEVMTAAHWDIPVHDFPTADGIRSVTIDAKSGMLPSPLTPEEFIVTEKFNAGFAPTEESTVWAEAPVCADSGLLPTENCPLVETRVFLRRLTPWVGDIAPQDAVLEAPNELCGIHGPGGVIQIPDDGSIQIRLYGNVERTDETTAARLSWYASRVDANTTFHVLRSDSPNTPANLADRIAVLGGGTASYADSFAPTDIGTYYYYIQAIDKTDGLVLGTSGEFKGVIGEQPTGNPQTIPRLDGALVPVGLNYTVQLLWNEINPGNEAIYQVYRSEDPEFVIDASNLLPAAAGLTTNSFTDNTVVSGKTYYYRIAGLDLTLGAPIGPSTRLGATIP